MNDDNATTTKKRPLDSSSSSTSAAAADDRAWKKPQQQEEEGLDAWIEAIDSELRKNPPPPAADAATDDDAVSLASVNEEIMEDISGVDNDGVNDDRQQQNVSTDPVADLEAEFIDPVMSVLRQKNPRKTDLLAAKRGLTAHRNKAIQTARDVLLRPPNGCFRPQLTAEDRQMIAKLGEYADQLKADADLVQEMSDCVELRNAFSEIVANAPASTSRKELWSQYRLARETINQKRNQRSLQRMSAVFARSMMRQQLQPWRPPAAGIMGHALIQRAAAVAAAPVAHPVDPPVEDAAPPIILVDDDNDDAPPPPPGSRDDLLPSSEAAAVNNNALRLRRPPTAFVKGLSHNEISDGELFFVAICTWRTPWSDVDKKTFWPAWIALPESRRIMLLERNRADCAASISERLHPSTWFKFLCREDDAEMFQTAYIPDRNARLTTIAAGLLEDGMLAAHLVTAGAVRCMEAWVKIKGYAAGTRWPVTCPQQYASACEMAARCDRLGMVSMLYHKGGWPITPLTLDIAAARGNEPMLRYLLEASLPRTVATHRQDLTIAAAMCIQTAKCLELLVEKKLATWHESVVSAAVAAGSEVCLRYALDQGCRWDPMACVLASIAPTGSSNNNNNAERTAGRRTCIDLLRGMMSPPSSPAPVVVINVE